MLKRRVWWILLVTFVVLPLVEIYAIVQVGQVIGPVWTVLLLIADAVLGAWLIKREGRRAWAALQRALQQGRMPATELADGILILIGGTMMLTPGFVTDIVALFLILPVTRPVGRRILSSLIARRLGAFPTVAAAGFGGGPGRPRPRTQQRPGPGDVVQGEVVDE